jgi:hypothetical protein
MEFQNTHVLNKGVCLMNPDMTLTIAYLYVGVDQAQWKIFRHSARAVIV